MKESVCAECVHFDRDDCICTQNKGKLAGIRLSESLSEAIHDCEAYEEVRYRLTPKGILFCVLREAGYDIPDEELSQIWESFEEGMTNAGYVTKETPSADTNN